MGHTVKSKVLSNNASGSGALNIDHKSRSHAMLSASSAARWMACTPSAFLADKFGEDKDTSYAQEGTLAHEIAETFLRKDILGVISDAEYDKTISGFLANPLFNPEMLDKVPIYTDYCSEQYYDAKLANGDAFLKVESKLDLTDYIPDGFGTADCLIISADRMQIIDLKYGAGVKVYAENNPQLMIYALGAYCQNCVAFDGIKTIEMTIVQPRTPHGDPVSTCEMSVEDLLSWADTVLKPKAQLAIKGEGELVPGDHCRFCPVKNRCRKLAENNLRLQEYGYKDARILNEDEIADIMKVTPLLIKWAESVTSYAYQKTVEENKQWKGFKLVAGISKRQWKISDTELRELLAKSLPEKDPSQYMKTSVESLTAIEKLVGKKEFAAKFGDYIHKVQGKPVLVPEDDPRPRIDVSVDATQDFNDGFNDAQ